MISDARAEPPGESMRSTTAFTESSFAALSKAFRIVVLKAPAVEPNGVRYVAVLCQQNRGDWLVAKIFLMRKPAPGPV